MNLNSTNRATVRLRPVRYQFPSSAKPGAERDWDANWLVIEGQVRTHEGQEWSFSDPCLTTWEARSLSGWLRSVAAGTVEPTAWGSGDEPILMFTEPNVAFTLAERDAQTVSLRIHLSLEARPPWLTVDDVDLFEYFVVITLPPGDVAAAADEWDRQIAEFPER